MLVFEVDCLGEVDLLQILRGDAGYNGIKFKVIALGEGQLDDLFGHAF